MFAGGRVQVRHPLLVGQPAQRRTSASLVAEKQGRSGPLTFVTVTHEVSQAGRVVISEEQDLVYLEAARPGGQGAGDPGARDLGRGGALDEPAVGSDSPDALWTLRVDPVVLFRFSALTYNSHRIHYDADYTRTVEGYAGLVVHGPLQAIALAQAAHPLLKDSMGPTWFDYRILAPVVADAVLVASATRLSSHRVVGAVSDGRARPTATATTQWR
ncbi:hypothetical protein [Nostocoides sp. HKS02]|uniref:hypothetical protein n=1 Tax=Nostocoides sp. HKS02 TaxID=1813880 RepID=UPI001E63BC5F|nr:hypothetical protein [Tetrasphaera sp. HKS02]